MDDIVTLFYMKRTGRIKAYCSGAQTMAFYGDDAEDYSIIMDCIVVPYDEFIVTNREYHKVINGVVKFERS